MSPLGSGMRDREKSGKLDLRLGSLRHVHVHDGASDGRRQMRRRPAEAALHRRLRPGCSRQLDVRPRSSDKILQRLQMSQ